jgi:fibronectin type III domain protein
VIKVSDGKATASLAAFGISVVSGTPPSSGSVTLNWTPPTRNTDGSTLTNLAGYKVAYGKSAGSLTSVVQISNPGISSYVVDGLALGTWYFSIKSYTSSGSESAGSNTVSMTVQ